MFFTCNTEPLNRRDWNSSIKDTRPDFPPLSNINLHKPAFNLLFGGTDIKHVSTDVHSLPNELIFCEGLTWDPRATTYIKDIWPWFNVKKLYGSFGHLSLDGLDTSVWLIFGGFSDVVEELWGEFVLWTVGHDCLYFNGIDFIINF